MRIFEQDGEAEELVEPFRDWCLFGLFFFSQGRSNEVGPKWNYLNGSVSILMNFEGISTSNSIHALGVFAHVFAALHVRCCFWYVCFWMLLVLSIT